MNNRCSGVIVRSQEMWFRPDLFESAFGTFIFYTGEVTLKLVTLGRHNMQLDPDKSGNNVNRGKSMLIGILVWIGLNFSLIALFL